MREESAVRRLIGNAFVRAYNGRRRFQAKLFSLCASGGFQSFGAHSVIEPPVRLFRPQRIAVGADVYIASGSWLQVLEDGDGAAIVIGDGTSIAGGCVLSASRSIVLGKKVLFARNVYIADHMHAFEDTTRAVLDQGITREGPVEIGDGAWLGENVVVGPGVSIGAGAVVGANAVVLADVPAHAVAVGAPARIVREFGEPHVDEGSG